MSVTSVRKRTAEKMDGGDEKNGPCRVCQRITLLATLSDYGGMCFPCYAEYRREPLRPRVDVGSKDKGPRDWAYALKRRHQVGERITQGQIDCYRAALKPQSEEALP